jgi:hypothetical protein
MLLFYVDDSGNEHLTTFSAIGIPADRWRAALARWLAWRRWLRDEHGVDAEYRLHATDWVAGRGRPSRDPRAALNRSKPARWHVYVSALDTLAATQELVVLTVARPGNDRAAAYRMLMRRIEGFLAAQGQHGLVVVDGDSAELRMLHRELDLASRMIVEDPWKRDARESQWLQASRLRRLCGVPAHRSATRPRLHVAVV